MPVFWIGFNLLMFPMAGFVKRYGTFRVMAIGAAAGSAASLATALAPDLNTLITMQFIAGGCWGAVNVAAFTAAITFGRASREGAFLGMLFATLALAAFIRIGAYASDIAQQPVFDVILPWIPAGGWLLGAVLLWTARAAWQKPMKIA
jgi:MFS family permease